MKTNTMQRIGKMNPFNACTVRITGIGLIPLIPKQNPVSKTIPHTIRSSDFFLNPKTVDAINEAA
jgi:hypothetical protein